jgi:hypothetical protein
MVPYRPQMMKRATHSIEIRLAGAEHGTTTSEAQARNLEMRRLLRPRCLLMIVLLLIPLSENAANSFPFSGQERLEYLVKWDPPAWMFFLPEITAGKLTFSVAERTSDQNRPVHRFAGSAVSSSSLLKVNDAFESIAQGENLCAHWMKKRTHEGKRHREIEVTVDSEKNSAVVVEKDLLFTPPKTLKTESIDKFPACATDLLAAVYRARSLPFETGIVYQFPLTDNGRVKEVTLKTLGKENVNNSAGSFKTQKVEVQSFFGGLFMQRGTFYIWFTDDSRHLPVKFEMKVKLGKVYGNLIKVQE